jgi:hypothetical protein
VVCECYIHKDHNRSYAGCMHVYTYLPLQVLSLFGQVQELAAADPGCFVAMLIDEVHSYVHEHIYIIGICGLECCCFMTVLLG